MCVHIGRLFLKHEAPSHRHILVKTFEICESDIAGKMSETKVDFLKFSEWTVL